MKNKILVLALALSVGLNCWQTWNWYVKQVYLSGYQNGQKDEAEGTRAEIFRQYQSGQLKINIDGKDLIFIPKK